MADDPKITTPKFPSARAVHTEGRKGPEDEPLPEKLAETPVTEKSPARWAYERLILYIGNFEKQLDAEHEVAMGFSGGEAGVLRIEGIGYFDPDLITFYGTDGSGGRTQQVLHVSQLNVLLRAVPRARDEPNRIGFRLYEDLEKA